MSVAEPSNLTFVVKKGVFRLFKAAVEHFALWSRVCSRSGAALIEMRPGPDLLALVCGY